MTFIDWSDPEEMLGLLVEYVADELAESAGDPDRGRFLDQLSRDLRGMATRSIDSADAAIARALREVLDSQPSEFATDPVMAHVAACVEELQRIAMGQDGP